MWEYSALPTKLITSISFVGKALYSHTHQKSSSALKITYDTFLRICFECDNQCVLRQFSPSHLQSPLLVDFLSRCPCSSQLHVRTYHKRSYILFIYLFFTYAYARTYNTHSVIRFVKSNQNARLFKENKSSQKSRNLQTPPGDRRNSEQILTNRNAEIILDEI